MKLSDFQDLIKALYFNKDKNRGVSNTFIWLVEEVGELARNLNSFPLNKENLSEELTDIIAWTCSIANLLDINLENALKRKYPSKCIKCNHMPCECTNNRI